MDVEPDKILFGEKGVDDWSFAPDVILRMDDSDGFLLLEDDDQDGDPSESGSDWPILPGNQIVWIDDGDEAEPIAIVSADRAGSQATLEQVAHEWARGADEAEIRITESGEVQVFYEVE
ncbi:MAG: hypothetical protein NVSMB57_00520 [Actinomycetota bacterium]